MLEFIKANPWTFVIVGLVLVGAIVGVVIGVITKGRWPDRGLMKTPEGKPIRWHRSDLPIPVWYASDLAGSWIHDWIRASAEISKIVGRQVFLTPMEAPEQIRLNIPVPGAIVLKDDNGLDPDHGVTELRWDSRTGRILSVEVTLPEALVDEPEKSFEVALHEALHSLGLDHDDQRQSIMYPSLQDRPQEVTDGDKDLIRKMLA